MQLQDTADIKRAFVDHLDALRAYCKLVTRYGQRLTDAEKQDRMRWTQSFGHESGPVKLQAGTLFEYQT
ncbi:MAG: hypothetical protein QF744_15415, partial [SAR202 cluster bacterium]|nr:hypothetical protein [SAR202 cluster bacterium]